jgi:hypothetical protein
LVTPETFLTFENYWHNLKPDPGRFYDRGVPKWKVLGWYSLFFEGILSLIIDLKKKDFRLHKSFKFSLLPTDSVILDHVVFTVFSTGARDRLVEFSPFGLNIESTVNVFFLGFFRFLLAEEASEISTFFVQYERRFKRKL